MSKSSKPVAPGALADLTFEQALAELDGLVRSMESGELPLDDAIAAYKRGAELAKYCQGKLAAAEQQLKVLDGEALRPLDPSELKGGG
jgi:exodeoxyribonuclease VII small subunit